MIEEAERRRRARLYESGEMESPVRLFVFDGLRHAGWALPRVIDRDGALRESLEGMEGRGFACGALFVSEAAETALGSAGMTVEGALERYVLGEEWEASRGFPTSSLIGAPERPRGAACPNRAVLAFLPDPEPPHNSSWLAAYTDADRTFTCAATAREAPFALGTEDEPRLGRPVSVNGVKLFGARRRVRMRGPELARCAGVQEDLVYRLETSWRTEDAWADLHHVRKLAEVLGVGPEVLIRRRGGSPYP